VGSSTATVGISRPRWSGSRCRRPRGRPAGRRCRRAGPPGSAGRAVVCPRVARAHRRGSPGRSREAGRWLRPPPRRGDLELDPGLCGTGRSAGHSVRPEGRLRVERVEAARFGSSTGMPMVEAQKVWVAMAQVTRVGRPASAGRPVHPRPGRDRVRRPGHQAPGFVAEGIETLTVTGHGPGRGAVILTQQVGGSGTRFRVRTVLHRRRAGPGRRPQRCADWSSPSEDPSPGLEFARRPWRRTA
jgi:hypothetical protein